MFRRAITTISFAAAIALVPTTSLADPSAAQGASAAGLGPATNSATNTGGSSADSSTLQPAGTSSLQSSTGASSNLSAPTSNTLQAPASDSGTLQVIQGEADGATHGLGGGTSWAWLWWLAAVIIAIAATAFFWLRRTQLPASGIYQDEADADQAPSEPIKSHTLTITIARPAKAIFDFTLNPDNTAKWVDGIVAEEADEQPPKLGTIYKNQNPAGEWTEYEIVGFEPTQHFTMARSGSSYRVRYSFKPADEDETKAAAKSDDEPQPEATELEYREWVEDGELDNLFPAEALQKLKSLLES
jgi:hypothetical protein